MAAAGRDTVDPDHLDADNDDMSAAGAELRESMLIDEASESDEIE